MEKETLTLGIDAGNVKNYIFTRTIEFAVVPDMYPAYICLLSIASPHVQ